MYRIDVIGFGVAFSTSSPAIEFRDVTGLPALFWELAQVHLQFHLQGFNLRMILTRPETQRPDVYINKSPPLEDGLHKLFAGDRILIPGQEFMMIVLSSNWRKALRKKYYSRR